MSDTNSLGALSSLGLRTTQELQAASQPNKELGQEEFFELMVAQLRNQDPFEPMENGDFIGQIAQFSAVEGQTKMQESLDELAGSLYSGQSLQAANLVGRSVLAPTGVGRLEAGGAIRGAVELPSGSSAVSVNVYSTSGELVRKLELGSQASGQTQFQWDGIMDNGEFAPPGAYLVTADAQLGSGSEAVETLVAAEVESVTLNSYGGLQLNLAGLGSMNFSEVRQIM